MSEVFNPSELLKQIEPVSPEGEGMEPVPFDPDQALLRLENETREDIGSIEAGFGGLLQGATYDFADEIGGAGIAAWDYITGETEDFEYRDSQKKLERYFQAAQAQQPGAFLTGQIAGGFASPVTKALMPIGAVARLGKMAKPAMVGAGGALAGAGMSTGTIENEPGKILTDTVVAGVAAPVVGAGISKALKGTAVAGKKAGELTGKVWNKLVPEEKAKAIQKWGTLKVANVLGNLPEHWGEYIFKNPDRFDVVPETLEDLSETVVERMNKLRIDTDAVERKASELLSDDMTVSWPSIQAAITKQKKKFNINPKSNTGKNVLKAIDDYTESLKFRFEEDQARLIGTAKEALKNAKTPAQKKKALAMMAANRGKMTQRNLKQGIIDNAADIYKMNKDLTLDKETALLRKIDGSLREALKKNIVKKTPDKKEYLELMKKAAEGERSWKRLAAYFRPQKPEAGYGARSSLAPSDLTITRVKGLPKKTKMLEELDRVDSDLAKEIIESDIFFRTERGVLAGSRNVQGQSKIGEALGGLTGAGIGATVGGPMGAGVGFLTGQAVGKGMGAITGAITDKYGRKIAKKLVTKFSPHAGGVTALEEKIQNMGPSKLDEIIGLMEAGQGKTVIEILKAIPTFDDSNKMPEENYEN